MAQLIRETFGNLCGSMKTHFGNYVYRVCVFILFSFFFVSCKGKLQAFEKELEKFDSLKNEKTVEAGLKHLKKLRSKAQSPEEFLSIAKRERAYNANQAAYETVLRGIKKTDDTRLIAFLTYLAIEEKNYKVALPYIYKLYHTEYESLARELLFNDANSDLRQKTDEKFLLAAFDETGNEAFLVDAALCFIANGQLKTALALRNKRNAAPSKYPYFWAELAFDTGDFSVILEELQTTLALYDLHGAYDTALAERTKAHILLAADGSYGLGKRELARSYWTLYADIFSDANPLVFYDLALSSDDVSERARALLDCVQNFPEFYPAAARYVRDYISYRRAQSEREQSASLAESESERLLQKKGLYSADMEAKALEGQYFILDPETLLRERAAQYSDPRYELELLRYKIVQEAQAEKYTGELWKILEKYPESAGVREFAKWYFSRLLQFDTAFGIAKTEKESVDSFYEGLQASLAGETAKALRSYEAAFSEYGFECASRVNYACTESLLGKSDIAINTYTDALKYTDDKTIQSKIHYRIAEILAELRQYDRAKDVLRYALQLDPSNYLAENLLQKLSY